MGRDIPPLPEPHISKETLAKIRESAEKLEKERKKKKAPEHYSEEARKQMVEMFPDEYKL